MIVSSIASSISTRTISPSNFTHLFHSYEVHSVEGAVNRGTGTVATVEVMESIVMMRLLGSWYLPGSGRSF